MTYGRIDGAEPENSPQETPGLARRVLRWLGDVVLPAVLCDGCHLYFRCSEERAEARDEAGDGVTPDVTLTAVR